MSSPCPDEEVLASLLESSLSAVEASPVREHLDDCDDCQEVVVSLVKARRDARDAPTPEVESPSRIGPFKVLGLLGKGGMGRVYRVYDERLHRDVAVKILPAHVENDPEWLSRFEREARAIGQLDHPNILAVHEVGSDDGAPYVVTELLEGTTLRAALRAPIPLRRAVEIAADVASGLAAAHDKRIVHRDLKPENIFLTSDGRVKILDFGLAKHHGGHPGEADQAGEAGEPHATVPGVVLGTVGYMAPEQVLGRPADPRGDLFSLGVVFYEMLAGRPPFRGTDAERLSAILRDDPPPLPDEVPHEIARLVRRLLEKDPLVRFQSARDLAFDLRDAAGDLAATTGRRRSRTLPRPGVAVLALAAAVAIGALAAITLRPSAARPRTPRFERLAFANGKIGEVRFLADRDAFVFSTSAGDAPGALYFGFGGSYAASRIADRGILLAASRRGEIAFLRDTLAYRTGRGYDGTLAVMAVTGGGARTVAEHVSWAAWTPGGDTLAYTRVDKGGVDLQLDGRTVYHTDHWLGPFAFSPDGKEIAIAESDSAFTAAADLLLVDLAGHARTLRTKVYVGGVAWAPDGRGIYYGVENDRSLHRVGLDGDDEVIVAAPQTLQVQDVDRDGRILITSADSRHHIFAHRREDRTENDLVSVERETVSDLSSDGETLAIAAEISGIDLLATDGGSTAPLGRGYFPAMSPSGRSIAALDDAADSHIFIYDRAGGEPRVLDVTPLTRMSGLSYTPDERELVFSASEPGSGSRIYRIDVAGGAPRPFTGTGATLVPTTRAVSPDGRWVVGLDQVQQFKLYPLAGGEPRLLPGMRPEEWAIGWTADSTAVYVVHAPSTTYVDVVDIATGARRPLPGLGQALLGADAFRVHVTPDGLAWTYTQHQQNVDAFVLTR